MVMQPTRRPSSWIGTTTTDKGTARRTVKLQLRARSRSKRHRCAGSVAVVGSMLLVLSSSSSSSMLWVESAAPHNHHHYKNHWFREILQRAVPGRRTRQQDAPLPPSAVPQWNDDKAYETSSRDRQSKDYFDHYESISSTTGSPTRSPITIRKTRFLPGFTRIVESLTPSSAEQQQQKPLAAFLGRNAGIYYRIGFAAFLGYTLYQMVNEIVEEYRRMAPRTTMNADGSDGIEMMPAYTPLQVQHFVDVCLDRSNHDAKLRERPDPSLNRVGVKLLLTGLPVQSTNTAPSVESILLQLTRSEVQLLEKCLWSPPLPDEDSSIRASSDSSTSTTTLSDSAWDHIAGLESVQQSLRRTLKLLLQESQPRGVSNNNNDNNWKQGNFASLFSSGDVPLSQVGSSSDQNNSHHGRKLVAGVLLYGPPGCGKTLLVKALANTGSIPCLVVTPSVLLSKYVGETNQRVRTLFSLASKLGPCVLCLDELDGILRERHDQEHDVSRELKTEFLQWWDGLLQGSSSNGMTGSAPHPMLVLGATNRPFDVDAAVLRRFPQSHYVGLPCLRARYQLLKQWLAPPMPVQVDWDVLAERTQGYTPSDLRHALQAAVMAGPMQRRDNFNGDTNSSSSHDDDESNVPFLTTQDVLQALQERPPTQLSAQYQKQLSNFARRGGVGPDSDVQGDARSDRMYDESSVTTLESGASKWETRQGNFYNIGTLEIDSATLDILTALAKNIDMEHYFSTNDNSDDEDDDEDELS